jgi:hypothetical protein
VFGHGSRTALERLLEKNSEFRIQNSEDRRQKTEDRRQKTEDRRPPRTPKAEPQISQINTDVGRRTVNWERRMVNTVLIIGALASAFPRPISELSGEVMALANPLLMPETSTPALCPSSPEAPGGKHAGE